jgi:hypothetical protein
LEVLKNYRNLFGRRPELWPYKWILHHDNAPALDALRVCKFLAKKSITKMDHPSYSSDLKPLISGSFQNYKCSERTKIC